MKDTLPFLLKVLGLSAAISLTIKAAGIPLSPDTWNLSQLTPLVVAIVILPSLLIGAFLAVQWSRQR